MRRTVGMKEVRCTAMWPIATVRSERYLDRLSHDRMMMFSRHEDGSVQRGMRRRPRLGTPNRSERASAERPVRVQMPGSDSCSIETSGHTAFVL
jgi:hypothetical protein